jgi:hypothetical protein
VLDRLEGRDRPAELHALLEYSDAVASTLSAAPAICMARISAASSTARTALTGEASANSHGGLSNVTVP